MRTSASLVPLRPIQHSLDNTRPSTKRGEAVLSVPRYRYAEDRWETGFQFFTPNLIKRCRSGSAIRGKPIAVDLGKNVLLSDIYQSRKEGAVKGQLSFALRKPITHLTRRKMQGSFSPQRLPQLGAMFRLQLKRKTQRRERNS